MKKKIMASILAVCMFVGMAVPAFAVGETTTTTPGEAENPAITIETFCTYKIVRGNTDYYGAEVIMAMANKELIETDDIIEVTLYNGDKVLSTSSLNTRDADEIRTKFSDGRLVDDCGGNHGDDTAVHGSTLFTPNKIYPSSSWNIKPWVGSVAPTSAKAEIKRANKVISTSTDSTFATDYTDADSATAPTWADIIEKQPELPTLNSGSYQRNIARVFVKKGSYDIEGLEVDGIAYNAAGKVIAPFGFNIPTHKDAAAKFGVTLTEEKQADSNNYIIEITDYNKFIDAVANLKTVAEEDKVPTKISFSFIAHDEKGNKSKTPQGGDSNKYDECDMIVADATSIKGQETTVRPAIGPGKEADGTPVADYNYHAIYDKYLQKSHGSYTNREDTIRVKEDILAACPADGDLLEISQKVDGKIFAYFGIEYTAPADATHLTIMEVTNQFNPLYGSETPISLTAERYQDGFDIFKDAAGKWHIVEYIKFAELKDGKWERYDGACNRAFDWIKEGKVISRTDLPLSISTYKAPVTPPVNPPYNPPAGGGSGGSSNTPTETPPAVTEGANGSTDVKFDDVPVKDSVVTDGKTVAESEIKLDKAVTDKATKENPVEITTTISASDAKSAIANASTKEVEIKLVVPQDVFANDNISIAAINVDSSIFEQAKTSGKDLNFTVETPNGNVIATWTFDAALLNSSSITANLAVNLKDAPVALAPAASNPVVVSFNHSGVLPGKAVVNVSVVGKYLNGQKLFLYYDNKATGKLELVGQNLTVNNGRVDLTIDHCSDYVLTASAVSTATGDKTTPPATGVADGTYLVWALALIALAGVIIVGKKKLLAK